MADFAAQAKIILDQLGGTARLNAMLGAHNFVHSNEQRSVAFTIRVKNRAKINHITVYLLANDTYCLEYRYIRGINVTDMGSQDGIYAEDLKANIERATGLSLSLI